MLCLVHCAAGRNLGSEIENVQFKWPFVTSVEFCSHRLLLFPLRTVRFFELSLTLRFKERSQILSWKMFKDKQRHMKVLVKIFHFYGRTLGFCRQMKTLLSHHSI